MRSARSVATARRIDPTKSPRDVYHSLQRLHPSSSRLKTAVQRDLLSLRAFIAAHRLLTLPRDAHVRVVDTPAFERQTTFAAMDAPGPLEKRATEAYYYVTPADPRWSAKQKDEYLGTFNDYARSIISAHEVYPGHFVNFAIERRLPLSLTRRLLGSASFSEGWAHYGEEMMVDAGWGGADPRVRLAQLAEALLRECRYVVGVREHTRGMTVEQATRFFMANAFMDRQPAYVEAVRGTQDPTYGYYTLGKLEILKLRDDYKKRLGSGFTLQAFHDALLSHGDPPIPLLRKILLRDQRPAL
jgi:uncharacterized protein (DUF885 family)